MLDFLSMRYIIYNSHHPTILTHLTLTSAQTQLHHHPQVTPHTFTTPHAHTRATRTTPSVLLSMASSHSHTRERRRDSRYERITKAHGFIHDYGCEYTYSFTICRGCTPSPTQGGSSTVINQPAHTTPFW